MPQEYLRHPADAKRGDGTPARAGWARALQKADLPGDLDDRYVPRGYGVILGEGIGSAGSDGCPTIGDRDEAISTRAVIDWVNGRARAFDADGRPVRASWATGAVGMTGVSYDGTLANMVATTGVPGLKTIVPISAISSWYDYYRANGLVVAPHSETQGVGENALPGRGRRRARRVHGRQRADRRALRARHPAPGRAAGPHDRRRQPVLASARLPPLGARRAGERLPRPRAERLEREDEGVRRVVGAAARAAEAVAPQRRPRRAGRGRVRRHRQPLVRPRAVRRAQRHPRRAARAGAAPGRQLRHQQCLAGPRHPCDPAPPRRPQRDRAGHPRHAALLSAAPALRRPRARARHRRRAAPGPRHREPQPARLPVARAAPSRAPQRHARGDAARIGRQPLGGEPHRGTRRLRAATRRR